MNINLRFYASSIFLLCLIAGCKKNTAIKKSMAKTDFKEVLAMHSEIPDVMLGFFVERVIHDKNNPQNIEIVYRSKQLQSVNQEDVKALYLADMELLGWRQVGEFSSDDATQLLFERAGNKQMCRVSIDVEGSIKVTVFAKK